MTNITDKRKFRCPVYMRIVLWSVAAFILMAGNLPAQDYEMTLNQRRMGSQIGVEVWVKSLTSTPADLGNMTISMLYNETFLKPAATTAASTYDTGNPASVTDSIYYTVDVTQPYISITSPYSQAVNDFSSLTAQAVEVSQSGSTVKLYTLQTNLDPNGSGYAPSSEGRGTFVGLVKFDIVQPAMTTLSDDDLTEIEFNTAYSFAPMTVVTDKSGNDLTSVVQLADAPDFSIRDITILSPNRPGAVIKRYSDPALKSIAPNPGFPVYFERSGLLSDVSTYGTYGTETLGYQISLSLDNGVSFTELGRVVETAVDANSMGANRVNYRTGEIATVSTDSPYYITLADGTPLPTTANRPSHGIGGVMRVILEGNENYAYRSEDARIKVSQLQADDASETVTTGSAADREVFTDAGRYDITDYTMVLSRMFFAQLNGEDQYFRTKNIISTPAEITVSAWVNLNSAGDENAEPAFLASGNPTSDNEGPWMLFLKNGVYPAFRCLEQESETFDEYVAEVVSPIALTPVTGESPITFEHGDNWVHLAATVDDGTVILYMNGEIVAKETNLTKNVVNIKTMQHPVYIGVNPNHDGLSKEENFVHAGIKEVKMWRTAIEQDQLRAYIAGIYEPANVGTGFNDRRSLELYYPMQANTDDYATQNPDQWGEQEINFYSGGSGLAADASIQYRPDRAHITLTSPIGGEGVSNLQGRYFEVRWAGYGLGSVNPSTNDLQIMVSRDGGTTWFDAIGVDGTPALPLDQVEIEDGSTLWSPYNNNTISDYDNDLQSVVSVDDNYSKSAIMKISGTEADGLEGIYAVSEEFTVAPNFAFYNSGAARVTVEDNDELAFNGNTNMIEAWIKPYRFPTEQEGYFPIFNKKSENELQYSFRLLPTGQLSLSVLDTMTSTVKTAVSPMSLKVTKPNSVAADSTWTHVAVWVNLADGGESSSVRFYIDGVTDLDADVTGQLGANVYVDRNNSYPAYIGYEPNSANIDDANYFIGEFKEVRFWNGNPGDVTVAGVEPSDLTLFLQGAQGVRADELTTFAGVNYQDNLVAAWTFNGGSWINSGLQKSIAVYPSTNQDLIAVAYGDGYEYKSTEPFIKLVEPVYEQSVSNQAQSLRVRWVGWDYDRNDGSAPFRNGSDGSNHADLDFSVGGGGGVIIQPYQNVASQAYNDSYQNAMQFNYLDKAYEFLGSGSRTQYAVTLDMSNTDPDENDDYTYSDQGPIPASQANGRFKLVGRATINGSELTYDNGDDGLVYHLLAESELFNITPPSNFTVRVLLEGYHKGSDASTGGIENDLGPNFASKGLSIELFENQANLPGDSVAAAVSTDGYYDSDALDITNKNSGENTFANVPFVFTDLKSGRYFVTVDHINHLPVTSAYAAPFDFTGDDMTTWSVESGWDFTGWDGVTNNNLTVADALASPPAMGTKYPATGPSETNPDETAYARTQLIYNDGQAGNTTTGMLPAMVAGDVYRDGTIDAFDRAAVNQNVGGISAAGDVTGDGIVNATDRLIVYRNQGMTTSPGDHPTGAVVTEYTPSTIAAPLQNADYRFDLDNNVVAEMVRAEQNFYENGGTNQMRLEKQSKKRTTLMSGNDMSFEVSADVEKIDGFIDVAVYIKNTGDSWAMGNTTIGLKYDPSALRYDAYFGGSNTVFSNSDYGYNDMYSNPAENTVQPISGLRTIDIVHAQDAPGIIGGSEVPSERTYLGTLRFRINRTADYEFSWHTDVTAVHDVDGKTLTGYGEFKYIKPVLIEQTAEISYPVAGESLLAGRAYYIEWTQPTDDNMMVDVLFSDDNGSSWETVNTEPVSIASRELYWMAPNINSNDCLVKLREVETGTTVDVMNNTFTVTKAPVEIVKPCGTCGSLLSGSMSEIVWQTERDENVFFEFSADGVNDWTIVSGLVSTLELSVAWEVPQATTADAVVRMINQEGEVLAVSSPFAILSGALSITSPNGEIVTGGENVTITWLYDSVDEFSLEYSVNGGQKWETVGENINAANNSMMWYAPNVATNEAMLRAYVPGNPKLEYSRVTFAIAPNTDVQDPATLGYSLSDAKPNPFSETAQMSFTLPEREVVTAEMYDVAGNKVAVLIDNQTFAQGTHTFTVEAKGLTTGTYFVHLRVDQFTLTQRVIVIK